MSFERATKALVSLHRCADSPEPSLIAFVTSINISWASLILWFFAVLLFTGHGVCNNNWSINRGTSGLA